MPSTKSNNIYEPISPLLQSTTTATATTSINNNELSSIKAQNFNIKQSTISNRRSNHQNNNIPTLILNNNTNNIKSLTLNKCEGCGELIFDLYHLVIASKFYWHIKCLKCDLCKDLLKNKCFIKNGKIYCANDYLRINQNQHGYNSNNQLTQTCKLCNKQLNSNDYVIRLNENNLYHLNCFKCIKCLKNIQSGQKYGLHDGKVYCDKHYVNECNLNFENLMATNEQISIKTEINDQDQSQKLKINHDKLLVNEVSNDENSQVEPAMLFQNFIDTLLDHNNEIYYQQQTTPSSSSSSSSSVITPNSSSTLSTISSLSPNEWKLNNDSQPLKFNFNINPVKLKQHTPIVKQKDYYHNETQTSINDENLIESLRIIDLTPTQSTLDNNEEKQKFECNQLKQRCLTETDIFSNSVYKLDELHELLVLDSPIITGTRVESETADSSTASKISTAYDDQSSSSSSTSPIRTAIGMKNKDLSKKKRMRTSFKHQQLRIMKAYFQQNQNPDAKELRDLSERTSLSKRTLQVWFQNSRAKQRKVTFKMQKSSQNGSNLSPSSKNSNPQHIKDLLSYPSLPISVPSAINESTNENKNEINNFFDDEHEDYYEEEAENDENINKDENNNMNMNLRKFDIKHNHHSDSSLITTVMLNGNIDYKPSQHQMINQINYHQIVATTNNQPDHQPHIKTENNIIFY